MVLERGRGSLLRGVPPRGKHLKYVLHPKLCERERLRRLRRVLTTPLFRSKGRDDNVWPGKGSPSAFEIRNVGGGVFLHENFITQPDNKEEENIEKSAGFSLGFYARSFFFVMVCLGEQKLEGVVLGPNFDMTCMWKRRFDLFGGKFVGVLQNGVAGRVLLCLKTEIGGEEVFNKFIFDILILWQSCGIIHQQTIVKLWCHSPKLTINLVQS